VGERVLAYDEVTGTTGYYPVTATSANLHPVVVFVTIEGETIQTTPEHPFFVEGVGWWPAGELQVGDHIHKADGTTGKVQAVVAVYHPQMMYNLSIAQAHTFFVGDEQ
jgi:hypothetical protein